MQKEILVRQYFLAVVLRRSSLILLVPLLMSATLLAQELGTAVISGEVSDPQGAIVRSAQVTVVQKSTGLSRKTASNAAGLFAVNDLAPGLYEVHVVAGSFAEYASSLQLEVGQQANLKIRLAVQAQQTVVDINDVDAVRWWIQARRSSTG